MYSHNEYLSNPIEDALMAAVDKGCDLLDNVKPDWYKYIDPQYLNVADSEHCVLGQVFHNLFIERGKPNCSPFHMAISMFNIEQPDEFGFDAIEVVNDKIVDDESFAVQYSVLAEMWIEKAEKRLAEDGLM